MCVIVRLVQTPRRMIMYQPNNSRPLPMGDELTRAYTARLKELEDLLPSTKESWSRTHFTT